MASITEQAQAIYMIAVVFRDQGVDQSTATESILAVLDTSATTVNEWAAGIVAETYRKEA